MAKGAKKSTKKFVTSGRLKKTIETRKKHQQLHKKIQGRRGTRGKGKQRQPVDSDGGSDEEERAEKKSSSKCVQFPAIVTVLSFHRTTGMSVDDFLGAKFMDDEGSGVSLLHFNSGKPETMVSSKKTRILATRTKAKEMSRTASLLLPSMIWKVCRHLCNSLQSLRFLLRRGYCACPTTLQLSRKGSRVLQISARKRS